MLLLQETWALPRDVGKINQYFPKYNTFRVSTINDDAILAGRPYGGCSFLYRKSISSNIGQVEINSNRICCISLNTNIGKVYIFNVYFPCDNATQSSLQLYNEMLSTISTFLHDNNVVNCIGGDLNTDLSRVRSGNTISLNNFISNESLSMVQQHVTNSIQYTFLGCNQSKSIIDHFIVSKNIERYVQEYYTKESVDNLSDNVRYICY